MRALLERSNAARAAVALVAIGCILGFVHAAAAVDDPGLRRDTFLPDAIMAALGMAVPQQPTEPVARQPVLLRPAAPKHHHPRRIWAAARGRPLRIALLRPRKAVFRPKPPVRPAPRPIARPANAIVLRFIPPPSKTPLVSIYADRTLRSGDAVMLDDGLHVFRNDGFWPHRPRDFVRLQSVAGLDWHLRQTLAPFDKNPPTRWTSIMVPPA